MALLVLGRGDEAMHVLAALALERGGWGPAPGDTLRYDPHLISFKRATIVVIDQPPMDCHSGDRSDRSHGDCDCDFSVNQQVIRFGPYTFMDSEDATTPVARTLDDMLSVYIEEVGHSWQEYCYETEGRCAGTRTRITTWGEGNARANGWEYQVKRYILGLDGELLALSSGERHELVSAICEGYARPYFTVMDGPPPPGWPHPEGWPVTLPTAEELAVFCESALN